jgi:hypothetical protein
MRIPVFVSCPSSLSPAQEESRKIITKNLHEVGVEWRGLGRTDYPSRSPLREVLAMARHCSGGVILGFNRLWKSMGASRGRKLAASAPQPTPWNHLEAGILFGLDLPLLVFREDGIEGGIFDLGVGDIFIHRMPAPGLASSERRNLAEVFRKWNAEVYAHYYPK